MNPAQAQREATAKTEAATAKKELAATQVPTAPCQTFHFDLHTTNC